MTLTFARDGSFVLDVANDAVWLEHRLIPFRDAARDPAIRYVSFTRNFGHQAALTAGLDHASGDAVVSLDSDLQHPPEIVPDLIDRARALGIDPSTLYRKRERYGLR